MKIYNAHSVTKEYIGQGLADPDPLDEGNWLIPAYAYTDEPPSLTENEAAIRDGNVWKVVADFRGTLYYMGTAEQHTITELGTLPPEGSTTEPPPPTQEQQIETFRVLLQAHMDAAAKAAGYDDLKTVVTYAEEPAVPKFQAEGKAFRAWRSLVWAYGYEQLEAVQSGNRLQPTPEELIAELPELVIAY